MFQVTISPQQSSPVVVYFEDLDTLPDPDPGPDPIALITTDYTLPWTPGMTVTIPANQSTANIRLDALADQNPEGSERAYLRLVNGDGYVVDAGNNTAYVTIHDPEVPEAPIFISPTPDAGSVVAVEFCDTFPHIIDTEAEDQDSIGNGVISYELVNAVSGFTIDSTNGDISVSNSALGGTYSVTVRATDDEGAQVDRQFDVDVLHHAIPGATSVSLKTATSDGLTIEIPANQTTGHVELEWTDATDADTYEYELWKWVDGIFVKNESESGQQSETSADPESRLITGLDYGLYMFRVRGTNCGGTQAGDWDAEYFVVAEQGDLELDDPSQDNNWEDACECSEDAPPSEAVGAVSVLNSGGDLWANIGNFFGEAGEALSSFVSPVYQTGGLSKPTLTASANIPVTPNAIQATLSVVDSLGTVVGTSVVDLDPADFLQRAAGLFSVLFDAETLVDSNDQPVASLASGNYDVDIAFDVELPVHSEHNSEEVVMSITASSVSMDYENPADTTFASNFAAGGVDRLRVRKDANNSVESLTLVRSNSTSVRFEANGGSFTTPDGSYVDVTASSMSIPDPNGGIARTAAYRFLSVNGEEQFFDQDGLLLATCTPHGDDIMFGYDSNDRVNKISSAHTDESVTIATNETNGTTTVTDWAGRAYVYYFTMVDGERVINRVVEPARGIGRPGAQLDFTYNPAGLLESLETRQGGTVVATTPEQSYSFTYDDSGNVDTVTWNDVKNLVNPSDRVWDFDPAESALMDAPVLRQAGWGTVAGSSGGSAFIDGELLNQITYPDLSVATYTTDAFGNVVNMERTVNNYQGSTLIQTSVTRNASGQVTVVQPMIQLVDGVLDSSVLGESYGYDAEGRLTSISYPDGTSETWTFTSGLSTPQPDTFTNRVGHYYEYQYGTPGSPSYGEHQNPTKVTMSSSVGGVVISSSYFEYESDGSRLKSAVYPDPNGAGGTRLAVENFYDDNKNLIHSRQTTASSGTGQPTLAASSAGDIWTSFGYDSFGNLDWSTSAYQTSSLPNGVPADTDSDLLAVKYDIQTDNLGAVTSITTPSAATGGSLTTTTEYDFLGRVKSATSAGSNPSAERTTDYEYTSFGEVESITLPDPGSQAGLLVPKITFDYNVMGNVVQQTSFNGSSQVSRSWYQSDSLGRVVRASLPLGDGLGVDDAAPIDADTFFFEYDAAGRSTLVKQPVAEIASTSADFFVTSTAYNDVTRQVQTSYSSEGSVADPGLSSVTQIFDSVGRPTSQSQGGLTTSWEYRDYHIYQNTAPGTLVRITDSRNSVWWVKQGPTGQTLATWTPDPDGGGALTDLKTQTDYDHRGNIDEQNEWAGGEHRQTDYTFDYRDLLTSVALPIASSGAAALTSTMQYDVLHRVTKETSTSGEVTNYGYRDDGLLGSVTRDPLTGVPSSGRTISFGYDNLDRQISVTTPDGISETIYDALGNVSQTLSPTPSAGLSQISRTYTYDTTSPGQYLFSVEDTDGSTTKFSNDRAGRVVEVFAPKFVQGSQGGIDDPGDASLFRTSWFDYDAAGQLTSSSTRRSATQTDTISYQYDGLGRTTSAGDGIRNENYVYNSIGDLTAYTDPLGRVTEFDAFDTLGRPTETTRLLDGADNDTTKVVFDSWGRTASVSELHGVAGKEMTTSFGYDSLDRTKTITNAVNGQVEYFYDSRGFLEKVDNELDHTTYFKYDDFGRLEATWLEGFSEASGATVYSYDIMDRVSSIHDPLQNVTTYSYDNVGRTKSVTEPGSRLTAWTYDDTEQVASITDPIGNTTEYFYDHRDLLRRDRIDLDGQDVDRNYWYDETGNMTWSSDREGRWTGYQYDFAYGAPGSYVQTWEGWWLPGNQYANEINFDYDNTEGNGLLPVDIYEYDTNLDPTGMTSRIQIDYDGLARPESITSWIDFSQNNAEAFVLDYKYEDKIDRRTEVTASFADMNAGTAEPDYVIDYVWDKLNRVDLITQSNLTYDPNPNNWGIEAGSTETVDLKYRADSSYDEIIRTDGPGNTVTTDFTYHADGQKHEGLLAYMNHSWTTNTSGATDTAAYSFTFDDHNRISTYATPDGTRTFGYDNIDQLTSVTGASSETYGYDANGNRNVGTTVDDYNRITQDPDFDYTYDKDSNRLTRTDRTTTETQFYEWDYRHRLISVITRASNSTSGTFVNGVEYEYDALDRRTVRRELITESSDQFGNTFAPSERFLYDSNILNGSFDEVVLILDETARTTTSSMTPGDTSPETGHDHVQNRFLNGPDVDQVFSDETTSDLLWYLTDHQNSVTDVIESESTGATNRNHIEYDSFGNIISVDDPTTAAVYDGDLPGEDDSFSPTRGYTGREPDPVTGLIYYRARWFDPNSGAFISEDPIGFAAGDTNLSRYVGNGTPNATDPSGLDEVVTYQQMVAQLNQQNGLSKPKSASTLSPAKIAELEGIGQQANAELGRMIQIIRALQTPSRGPSAEDKAWRSHNPRMSYLVMNDGSVRLVTDAMDSSINSSNVRGSTRTPRRYGAPGENMGVYLQPGTSAVPFCQSDWKNVRQERLSREAERQTQLRILETGIPIVGMASDVDTLRDPKASIGQKLLSTISLGVDLLPALGALPNAGSLGRSLDNTAGMCHVAPTRYVTNGPAGAMFDSAKPLTGSQRSLLGNLQSAGTEVVIGKKAVSMNDLRNLTLHTGDEFAMLTRRGERMIIRGDGGTIPTLNVDRASGLSAQGWRFSGHTHTPGFQAVGSPGDKNVLRAFGQRQSGVWGAEWGSQPGRFFGQFSDEVDFNMGLFR